MGVTLTPLRCPACEGGLHCSEAAGFLLCRECAAGFELGDDDALVPVPVSFACYRPGASAFYPFWTWLAILDVGTREGKRSLVQQVTFSRPLGLSLLFEERGSLRIYCAGFLEDLERGDSWSLRLTVEQPELLPAPRRREVRGMAFSSRDARAIADDVFLTSEISQGDTVRSLEYALHLDDPQLVVIGL